MNRPQYEIQNLEGKWLSVTGGNESRLGWLDWWVTERTEMLTLSECGVSGPGRWRKAARS